jgi:hypothetical protein
MLPKLNGHEKMFLHCPKYDEHVEAITICVDCSYFQAFVCSKIERAVQRLKMGEVTEEYLSELVAECRAKSKLWAVQCAHPVLRPCNSIRITGGEDQWQQQ